MADWAILELATRSTLHGHQLLGPYSRYGWHHPGPALFWWFAPFYWLSGERLSGLVIAAAVLSGTGCIVLVGVVGRWMGRVGAWAAAAACLWFTWSYGMADLRDPWNPNMAVLPVAVTVVLAVAVIAGSRWSLPVLVAAASFAVQVHLGTFVVVGSVVAVALIVVAQRVGSAPRSWVGPVGVAAIVGGVMWATVAYEQITRRPGNLTQLIRFSQANGGLHHPALQVAGRVAQLNVLRQPAIGIMVHGLGPSDFVFLGILAMLVLTGAVSRRAPRFLRSLCVLTLLAEVASVAAGRLVFGYLFTYLLCFVRGVALVALMAGAIVAASQLDWWSRRQPRIGWVSRASSCLVIVASVLLAVGAATLPLLQRGYSGTVSALSRPVIDALRRDGVHVARLELARGGRWQAEAALSNQLEKAGIRTTVDPSWLFMFGQERAPTGREAARLVVADAGQHTDQAAMPHIQAEAGGVVIYLYLLPPRALQQRPGLGTRPQQSQPALPDEAS